MGNGQVVIYPDDNGSTDDNRASFGAVTESGTENNPTDPNNLTVDQQRKSIGFKFTGTSQFKVEFYEFCSKFDPALCGVTGGNILFAGTADNLAINCFDRAQTPPPTNAP